MVVEQWVHNQASSEPMKLLPVADWTVIVEWSVSKTYKSWRCHDSLSGVGN
jgi:hypothetical protein